MNVGRVAPVAQCQPRELQPGDPAFGPLDQRRHLLRIQGQTHAVAEEGIRLLDRETQVSSTDLGVFMAGATPRLRQRRVLPARDDQVQAGRQVVDQEGDCGVDPGASDQVIVVEDQDARSL